jgi:hypothetical protein
LKAYCFHRPRIFTVNDAVLVGISRAYIQKCKDLQIYPTGRNNNVTIPILKQVALRKVSIELKEKITSDLSKPDIIMHMKR